jgi:nitrite reductase/ring-hydroxylating ferredoxin subunit
MNRTDFNKGFCSLFLITALGLPALTISCTKSEDDIDDQNIDQDLVENGIKKVGNTVTVSIEHPTFIDLKTPGNFINNLDNGLLILRKDATTVIALDNCCPHQGSRSRWRYLGEGKFLCTNHGNRFDIGEGNIASCNSNRTSGNLKQFAANLTDSIITIQLSQ